MDGWPPFGRLTSVAAAHCRQLVSGPTAQSHAFYMANNNSNNNNSNTSNVKKKRYTNYVKRQQQWQQHEKNTRNKKLYMYVRIYYIYSVSLKYLKAGGATSLPLRRPLVQAACIGFVRRLRHVKEKGHKMYE